MMLRKCPRCLREESMQLTEVSNASAWHCNNKHCRAIVAATMKETQEFYSDYYKVREKIMPESNKFPCPPTAKPTNEGVANDKQFGGQHYKQFKIQPWDFIAKNDIGYLAGDAIVYIARYKEKNGIEDLRKAIHFIEKLIEVELENEQDKK